MSQISQQFDHVYREWMVRPELELAFNIDNVKVNLKKLDKQGRSHNGIFALQ